MRCTGKDHQMHMCSLKAAGNTELIERFSSQPAVSCKHCGAKANSLEYVCAAHLGDQAPNVEGGHGHIDPEDAGKSHAG